MRVAEYRSRLTEAEFQSMIVDRARARGFLIHHDRGDYRTSIAGDPGFPDLVLSRRHVLAFVEVKSDRGKLTGPQTQWLESLSHVPADDWLSGDIWYSWRGEVLVSVWRPAMWDLIQEILA